ncbi:hypothetical protein CSC94_17870 [Zhengella mangrovi]|uniref:Flagellar protein FlgN n=1 Tax=Zhengella mangrovi TaxID=1982044 RepID=A0A2G1QJM2_9HYPH|nr:hypothetical protein [Zhengella mangrovi]PHP65716.1 hypothetical protein CSC94_17870 [Zhengella mangrovi]
MVEQRIDSLRKREEEDHRSIIQVLEAIGACLDGERDMLADRRLSELQAYNTRKSRLLYELSRAINGNPGWRRIAGLRERLDDLNSKLRANARSLQAQAAAVRSVADLVINEIRDSEDDGTYSTASVAGRL